MGKSEGLRPVHGLALVALLSSLFLFAGCQEHGVIDRYAGDLARYEETGRIDEPVDMEDELRSQYAASEARVIDRRRAALNPWIGPRIGEGSDAPTDLDVWRLATLSNATGPALTAMRDRSAARVDAMKGQLETIPALQEDDVLEGEEPVAEGQLGEALAQRGLRIHLQRALDIEERKLALIEEELSSR